MGFFQTNKIQSLIVFIIIWVAILWIFRDNYLNISFFEKSSSEFDVLKPKDTGTPYLEKIDNLIIKEYSNDQVLLHTIEADVYKSFKNSPIQLETVKVTTYDEFQNEIVTLQSNSAEIFKSGSIHLIGEVEIKTVSGVTHEFETEFLIVKDGQINSNRKIIYVGENERIMADGMDMNLDEDIMNLNGKVEILQDSGAKIDTEDLFIVQTGAEKKYLSNKKTVYTSNQNIVTADKGFDMDANSELTELLGNIEILDDTGSSIKSYDLIIDQSNEGQTFMTNSSTHLQSNTVDIKANKMHYDSITKMLKLTEEVIAIYE